MQLGHHLWVHSFCALSGALPLLQHLLTVLCPPSSWTWCNSSSWDPSPWTSVWDDAGRASLGSTGTAVEGLCRELGSCAALGQSSLTGSWPELKPWQHLRFFRCETWVWNGLAFVMLYRLLLFSKAPIEGAARKTCAFHLKMSRICCRGKLLKMCPHLFIC